MGYQMSSVEVNLFFQGVYKKIFGKNELTENRKKEKRGKKLQDEKKLKRMVSVQSSNSI